MQAGASPSASRFWPLTGRRNGLDEGWRIGQLLQQHLRVFQIGGVEALGEPAVGVNDLSEVTAALVDAARESLMIGTV
jgi:hypothetical protein